MCCVPFSWHNSPMKGSICIQPWAGRKLDPAWGNVKEYRRRVYDRSSVYFPILGGGGVTDLCKLTIRTHTANALYQRFETNIPRNETARPRSQFPHSFICKRFIYSHPRSANAIQLNGRTDRGNILIALRYMDVDVEIGNEAAQFHFWECLFRIVGTVPRRLTPLPWTTDYRTDYYCVTSLLRSLLSACVYCFSFHDVVFGKTAKTFAWARTDTKQRVSVPILNHYWRLQMHWKPSHSYIRYGFIRWYTHKAG
jgi:hypothetical protein